MISLPLLDVRDLIVEFHSGEQVTRAVDGISFSLGRSETLALVGESGSGKSVTALSVLGLLPSPPARIPGGAILFSGKGGEPSDLLQLPEKAMRSIRGCEISMIFQEPMTSLNPVYTCGDQVAESLMVHKGLSRKEAIGRATELFNEVTLPRPAEICRSYPHQLSGGQKQRVMIAMAIACDPKILIADEPTTALDVTVQKTILELLNRLQHQRGMSILFITHDLGLVAGFADRVMVMYRGKIVEEGAVGTLFKTPSHPYTRGLLACRPPAGKRLERLPTIEQFLRNDAAIPVNEVTPETREKEHQQLYARQPLITVERLFREYSGSAGLFRKKPAPLAAVDDVTLEVYQGETLGIVGESGCGKTTLARVILQLIPPTAGIIRYKETDITAVTAAVMKRLRKELQIIFQDPYSSLNPRMAIGPAILEPMKVHRLYSCQKARREKVFELLERVGLKGEHFYRYPHEFSGGQRQRICIARALAVEPSVVICDESVSALDISIQAQVLNLLNDLKRDLGLTYIFISHDLSVVKYMSDRVVVMRRGKIEEMGEADTLYANPMTEYTRLLLDSVPRF